MSPASLAAAAATLAAATPDAAPDPIGPTGPTDLAGASIGEPIVVANLAVYPLRVRAGETHPDYLTLEEALSSGVLDIHEEGTDGTVNELHVSNRSDRIVFALHGELLLGGKQDRIVGRNTLVPPRAKDFSVAVFCVEHGRWQTKTAKFESGGVLAHTKLRDEAAKESQSKVWEEVKRKNALKGTANATDTYREAAKETRSDGDVKKAVTEIETRTKAVPDMAGLAVAVDGKLRAVDWFASPALYRKLERKLLTSHVDEALDTTSSVAAAAPTVDEVRAFLAAAESAETAAEREAGEGTVDMIDAPTVHGQKLKGKDGKSVYKNYYAH